jgi:hypothetical protein
MMIIFIMRRSLAVKMVNTIQHPGEHEKDNSNAFFDLRFTSESQNDIFIITCNNSLY